MSTEGISLHHALFRQELARHVDRIKRLCAKWGIPELGTRVTLILRDPTNDAMSFVLTDEETPGGRPPMTKYCSRCQRRLPLVAFARHAGRPDGLQSWCRTCTSVARRRSYALQRGWLWVEDGGQQG